jgi:hypothetical protein
VYFQVYTHSTRRSIMTRMIEPNPSPIMSYYGRFYYFRGHGRGGGSPRHPSPGPIMSVPGFTGAGRHIMILRVTLYPARGTRPGGPWRPGELQVAAQTRNLKPTQAGKCQVGYDQTHLETANLRYRIQTPPISVTVIIGT